MKTSLQTVLLVASIITTTSKECSDSCFCKRREILHCSSRNLTQPPPGFFPQIERANLEDNKITVLYKFALTGFPMVNFIELENNELKEVDLEVFAPLPFLYDLNLGNNKINSLTASPGVRIEKLAFILLINNKLTSLDPDVFLAAPNLKFLSLHQNPIVAPSGQPILNHPMITNFNMGFASLGELTDRSFAGLPNLFSLWLPSCGITDITGAFIHNHELKYILLQNNNITEVKSGAFAKDSELLLLNLEDNPLALIETSAVADVMPTTGHIGIASSPFACECGYESLHWWTKSKGVSISALCNDVANACTFTKEAKEEL